jgi:thiamine-phosphate diphosphorylase
MPALPHPALVLVTDLARAPAGADAEAWLADRVAAAVDGGVNVVQLRERQLDTPHRSELAARLREAIGGRALLFVNRDIAAAGAAGADGVHLPADMSVATVRSEVRAMLLISCAVHGVDDAQRAARDGADLLVAGTVFPSASHPGGPTLGVAGLRAICDAVRLPVIAIGGITPHNAFDAIAAGASGVAAIGALLDAPDTTDAARRLRAAVETAVRVGPCV